MKVHLRQIKTGSLRLEGEESAAALGLEEAGATATGPLVYDIEAGLSGGGLFATGVLELPVRLRCVKCLEAFNFTVRVPDFAVQLQLEGGEFVDLTPAARDDIFLALPPYPHCDAAGDRTCPASFPASSTASGRTGPQGEPSASTWAVLDRLKTKSSKHHGSSKT